MLHEPVTGRKLGLVWEQMGVKVRREQKATQSDYRPSLRNGSRAVTQGHAWSRGENRR